MTLSIISFVFQVFSPNSTGSTLRRPHATVTISNDGEIKYSFRRMYPAVQETDPTALFVTEREFETITLQWAKMFARSGKNVEEIRVDEVVLADSGKGPEKLRRCRNLELKLDYQDPHLNVFREVISVTLADGCNPRTEYRPEEINRIFLPAGMYQTVRNFLGGSIFSLRPDVKPPVLDLLGKHHEGFQMVGLA